MASIIYFVLIFIFPCKYQGLSSVNVHPDSRPFIYTIILKNVDYTNGFDLENGIKSRTRFKCPLYYVDTLGLISEVCPENGANDTITINHSQDQLELVHSIRGLNFFYYRLDSGDTLSIHYEEGIPVADSPKQNLYYNLIKDNPFEKMRDRYYLELPGPNSLYNKYKSKDDFPPELERLLPLFRNLDTLYQKIKKSYDYQLDYVRNHSDFPDYWEGILNKEMRKLVIQSYFIDDSALSLYGEESEYDVYSISDRYYYRAKFIQNPDSIFNAIKNNDPGINPELARYYYQLYLNYSVDSGKPLKTINSVISQYFQTYSDPRDSIFIKGFRKKMGIEESLVTDIKISNKAGIETTLNQVIRADSPSLYYIDYWASWCAPCREEIPYSIELKKELEGMGIRFIYLAYNDRIENWKEATQDLNLSHYDYSWFITNSRSSQQLTDYNIKTIPRYMILDAKGKVMVANAKRPSDPEMSKTLINILNGLNDE